MKKKNLQWNENGLAMKERNLCENNNLGFNSQISQKRDKFENRL